MAAGIIGPAMSSNPTQNGQVKITKRMTRMAMMIGIAFLLVCHICQVLPVMVSTAYRCHHLVVAIDRLKRIAAAIRKRREELGITQEAVAYESGTSVRNYARIEAGAVNPRVLSLYQIAAVLKTTASRLLDAAEDGGRGGRKVSRP
jgi:DNA-binding XRE family transcriptional regulator